MQPSEGVCVSVWHFGLTRPKPPKTRALNSPGEPGRKLRKRIVANRAHLFVFMTNRDVPYTNNVSERNLRPSVIFRKVTNGFRCEWGAETYAAFRSVVSTAKANRRSVLDDIRKVLGPTSHGGAITQPG